MTSKLLVNMPTAIETSETGTNTINYGKGPNELNSLGDMFPACFGGCCIVTPSMTDAMRILWPHRPQPLSRFWSISWECSAVKGINMHWQSCFGETKPSYCHAILRHGQSNLMFRSKWKRDHVYGAVANFGSGFLQQPNQTKSWSSSHKSMTKTPRSDQFFHNRIRQWMAIFHYRPPAAPLEPRRCFCQSLGWAINMIYYWSIACNMIWLG